MSPAPLSLDSFKCRKSLKVGAKTYEYFSLPDAESNGLAGISKLPFSLKVLIENLLRHEDGRSVKADDIRAVVAWLKDKTSTREIAYRPARVLMQDFTGVPAVVDLAAMRDAMKALGGDPKKINPLVPVDLIIDHSVAVNHFGTAAAFKQNVEVYFNGVLVQDNVTLSGPTGHYARPPYVAHEEKLPLLLQDHGDRVRFRNVWVVPVKE